MKHQTKAALEVLPARLFYQPLKVYSVIDCGFISIEKPGSVGGI
jgi:hypothetical protein